MSRSRSAMWMVPLLVLAAGCGNAGQPGDAGGCSRHDGFDLSLVSDTGGRATPVAAARWFARHGGVDGVPEDRWSVSRRSDGGATLASADGQLHAVRGPDGTWQVDSGFTCG